MRIPSQFNDSSLYRPRRGDGDTPKRARVSGVREARRRLFRLSIALVLVIVVMREAGQSRLYETFFASGQDGWVSADAPNPKAASGLQEVGSARENDPLGESPTHFDTPHWPPAVEWVESMDLPLQRAWIQTLVSIRERLRLSGGDVQTNSWVGLSPQQIDDSIERLGQLDDSYDSTDLATAIEGISQMRDFSEGADVPTDFWETISSWATDVLDSLDKSALSRVSDGTFWTGADSDAFYLQLARASELPTDGAASTGTLPLLQQPNVYRGQLIRLVGTLQLAEKKIAKANRVGIESYWKVWMIPADGGIRPTILMTPQLPREIVDSLTNDGRWDGRSNGANPDGQFAAVGRFIKRLPYRSSVGADLAPVVIGRVVATRGILPGSQGSGNKGKAVDPKKASGVSGSNRWWGMILAVIGGIAIAVVLMYRVSKDAERSRRLRRLATESTVSNLDHLTASELASREEPKG